MMKNVPNMTNMEPLLINLATVFKDLILVILCLIQEELISTIFLKVFLAEEAHLGVLGNGNQEEAMI